MSGVHPAHSGFTPAASAAGSSLTLPFTPDEARQLIKDDIHAAFLVSGLMSLIFAMGLVLYSVVLITCL
jgi:hypothetical protein